MRGQLPPAVLYSNLSHVAVRVYAVLSDQPFCVPSRALLAQWTGASPAVIDEAMKELFSVGLVRIAALHTEHDGETQ